MESVQQQLIFTVGSLSCAALAAVEDVRHRRIPNRVTLPAVVAGLVLHAIAAGWHGLADSILAGVIAGAIFFLFFLAGGMAAGDVKLMMAVGCIAGCSSLRLLVVATAIAGGLLAVAVSIRHGRLRETLRGVGTLLSHHGRHGLQPHPDLNLRNACSLRLPFAVPIVAGCLFTLGSLAWGMRP